MGGKGEDQLSSVKISKQSQPEMLFKFPFNLPGAGEANDKTRIIHPTLLMFVFCVALRVHKSSEADYKVAAAGSDGAIYRGGVAQPTTPAD